MIVRPTRLTFLVLLFLGGTETSAAADVAYCADDLAHMSCLDLERIYRQAAPGQIPNGFAQGRVVYCPETFLAGAKSGAARLFWHGKHFCAADGTLINQWCGLRAIRGTVCHGTSWLDGKPSIILDYSGTSRLWSDVRDEMREIGPGLYLGAMYLRRCPEPRLKLYFILRTCQSR